jgi:hypothetical protein
MLNLELCSRILFAGNHILPMKVWIIHITHISGLQKIPIKYLYLISRTRAHSLCDARFSTDWLGSHFKTPSKRANVRQHFTQSTASTSWGYSLGDVTHKEVPPRFSWWVPAFWHGTYPSHWNVRSRSHALAPKSPHLKPPDIIKYKQNTVKHNSVILLRCILTLLRHVSALVMSHLLDRLDAVCTPHSQEKHSIQKQRLNTVILY